MIKNLKELLKLLSCKYQKIILDYPVTPKPRNFTQNQSEFNIWKIIGRNNVVYKEYLSEVLKFSDYFLSFKYSSDSDRMNIEPTWNNGYLPGLDIVTMYTLTRILKPKRIIEIGSGNSTRIFHRARLDGNLSTEIISIDPDPRVSVVNITNTIYKVRLEDIKDINFIIDSLEKDDFLFVDNSHQVFPNSDAMVVFMELLPNIKSGVLVHFHDIYLPFDYPQFMCDRFYNEQYFLASFIINNPSRYEVILPNYFISEMPELSEILQPLWENEYLKNVEKHGGSLWIRIH